MTEDKKEIDCFEQHMDRVSRRTSEVVHLQINTEFILPKDILGLWEQTVCEIRSEVKAQETPALVYAKELCDKLEHSMCALAGGPYNLKYSIE